MLARKMRDRAGLFIVIELAIALEPTKSTLQASMIVIMR
jgi:hypothetical protein